GGAGELRRRTFLGAAIAVANAPPLFAALRGGRWDDEAEVLERAAAAGSLSQGGRTVNCQVSIGILTGGGDLQGRKEPGRGLKLSRAPEEPSPEYRPDRRLLLIGKEVAVAAAHRLRLAPHPSVGDPLVDALQGAVAGEGVPEHVIA